MDPISAWSTHNGGLTRKMPLVIPVEANQLEVDNIAFCMNINLVEIPTGTIVRHCTFHSLITTYRKHSR
jgi:hypothetical protein